MDTSDNNNQPAFNLPKLSADQTNSPALDNDTGLVPKKNEPNATTSELPAVSNNPLTQHVPATQAPTNPLTPPPIPNQTRHSQVSQTPVDTPDTAADSDLIEQEWVDKAKAIVERTKEDPFTQNEAINKMKADYIKKRYNREIKASEE